MFSQSRDDSIINLRLENAMQAITFQSGVTCTVRHRVKITCRGVTIAANHAAHSHFFVYISKTYEANIIGLLRFLFVRERALLWLGRQLLQINSSFFYALEISVFFLQSLISQTVLCVPLTVE